MWFSLHPEQDAVCLVEIHYIPLHFSTYRQVLIVLSESEIISTCVHPIKDADSYSVTPLVNTLMLHLESHEVECASYLQHNYKSRDGAGQTK